ncbi:unnamed protein product [Gulo gulo]|uniref:Uncharacterized protein n=1 Tax=Gulo gulo TaxID=48420 RepID=A0A9X9LFP7_GULGU|nr:unnamed protein product [Gulo gulo]
MASTTTSCGYLSTVASLQRATTSSWGTMSTGASSLWRPSACCWPIRSSTPRTSSCSVGTTSVPASTASTVSMMSARDATTLNCGKPLPTASTACPSLPSWMRRSSAATEACPQTCSPWNRFGVSCGPQTCLTRACCVTCCGRILTRTCRAGARMTVVSPLRLGPRWWPSSCTSTTWISSAGHTRWWKTAMSSLPSGSW